MRSNYKKLGNYIREVNVRNSTAEELPLLGINIDKFFMPSVANIVGTDLSTYKLVKTNQFACNRMHVGRDERLPVALSKRLNNFIVSPAYDVFEIIDPDILLPEYLMMWFSRTEYDRNAWFYTDADVRGGLHWDAFCEMTLSIPHPDKQKEIVKEYNTILNRINLNNQLIKKIEETAQAIYKQWFVEFEFPDKNGNPYKSSGGEMVINEELEKEIPDGWEIKMIGEISEIKAGGDKPNIYSVTKTDICSIPVYSNGITDEGLYGFTNKSNYPKNSLTISARGTIGYCVLRREPYDAIVRLIVVIPHMPYQATYLFYSFKGVDYSDSGSVQNQLTIPQFSSTKVILPLPNVLNKYDLLISQVLRSIELTKIENKKMEGLKNVLLSKLATIEN